MRKKLKQVEGSNREYDYSTNQMAAGVGRSCRVSQNVNISHLGGIKDLLHGSGNLGSDAISRNKSAFVYLAAVESRTGDFRRDLSRYRVRFRK